MYDAHFKGLEVGWMNIVLNSEMTWISIMKILLIWLPVVCGYSKPFLWFFYNITCLRAEDLCVRAEI